MGVFTMMPDPSALRCAAGASLRAFERCAVDAFDLVKSDALPTTSGDLRGGGGGGFTLLFAELLAEFTPIGGGGGCRLLLVLIAAVGVVGCERAMLLPKLERRMPAPLLVIGEGLVPAGLFFGDHTGRRCGEGMCVTVWLLCLGVEFGSADASESAMSSWLSWLRQLSGDTSTTTSDGRENAMADEMKLGDPSDGTGLSAAGDAWGSRRCSA